MTRNGKAMWLVRAVGVILLMSCGNHVGPSVTAEIARRAGGMIDVRVTNRTDVNILLISPTRPDAQVDEAQCRVMLSTKVQEWIRPYAFTPDLVELKGGETRTFAVLRQEATIPKCGEWRVDLEYAYLRSNAARAAQQRKGADFRGYVLRHQQIARN